MADPYLGEIRMFAGNFAPQQWAYCNGQLLAINEYQALYSLIGTTYGGDGRTSFAVPDMRGRAPVHHGQGPGLDNYPLGKRDGVDRMTLAAKHLPSHNHLLHADDTGDHPTTAVNAFLGPTSGSDDSFSVYKASPTDQTTLHTATLSQEGNNEPVLNKAPFLVINYIIALHGVYPPRN